MSTRVTNIIFDLGNVFFDWQPETVIRQHFGDQTLHQFQRNLPEFIRDWKDLDRGIITVDQAIIKFSDSYGFPKDQMKKIMQILMETLTLNEDTLQLAAELKSHGYRLYCLSNMSSEYWDYLHQTYPFWDIFEGIVISAHIQAIKPEFEIYHYLLNEHQLLPEECLFIDDLADNIEAGELLGIRGIRFSTVVDCRQQLNRIDSRINKDH